MTSRNNKLACDDFIGHIYDKYAKIQYSDTEIQKQKDFVLNIIHNIANETGTIDNYFTVDRVIGTGSFFSGTKVIAPDEFDFLAIIKTKYLALKRGCKKGFSHIRVISDTFKDHILSETVKSQIEKRSVKHFRHEILEDDHLSPCLIQYFYELVDRALINLNEQNLVKYNKDAVRVNSEKQLSGELHATQMCGWTWPYGPYIKLLVPGPVCNASVDFTFAFEIWNPETKDYHPVLLIPKSPANQCKYFENKSEEHSIYDNSICWTQTLSHTETKIIKNFKPEHKKIQMVLKLLNENEYLGQKFSAFDSYAIKTLVYHHDRTCSDSTSLSDCFREINNHIKDLLYAELFDIKTNVKKRLIFSLVYAHKVVELFDLLNSNLDILRPFKTEKENRNIDDIKKVLLTMKTLYQNIFPDHTGATQSSGTLCFYTPSNDTPSKDIPSNDTPSKDIQSKDKSSKDAPSSPLPKTYATYTKIKTFVETQIDKTKAEELQNSFAAVFKSILKIYDNKANADSTAGMEHVLHQIFLDFYKAHPKSLSSMHDPGSNILGHYFRDVDWLKLTDGWMEIWGVTRKIARSQLVASSFIELLDAIDGTEVDEVDNQTETVERKTQQETGYMAPSDVERAPKKDWDLLLKDKSEKFNQLGEVEPNWLWQFAARSMDEK